jgi:energy-coupling factor transporter ATP-binding protein EcfA2
MYENSLKTKHVSERRAANVIERMRWENTFTEKQLDVYRLFQRYIVHPDGASNKPPEFTWIVGPAGSGKSEVVKQIVSLCEHEGVECVRAMIRRQDCILFASGSDSKCIMRYTGHDIDRYTDFLGTKWWNDFESLMRDAVLLVIDDFFFCRPWQLAKLSKACEYATGHHDKPFGGIPTIACGDIRTRHISGGGRDYLAYVMQTCLNVWTIPYTTEE